MEGQYWFRLKRRQVEKITLAPHIKFRKQERITCSWMKKNGHYPFQMKNSNIVMKALTRFKIRNMKTIKYLLILLTGIQIFISCEKDPWKFDVSRKAGIYMDVDSIETYGFMEEYDSTWLNARILVKLVGIPENYDRPIQFAVAKSDTLLNTLTIEKDFILSDYNLKANETFNYCEIPIKCPTVELEDSSYFALKLVENEFFKPEIKSVVQIRVKVAHPERPSWWEETIFGSWPEKHTSYFLNITEVWQLKIH